MAQEFRFPIPSRERIVLIAVGLMGTGLIVAVLWLIRQLGLDVDMSLGELAAESTQLRGALASLVVVHLIACIAGVHHMRRWAATSVSFTDDGLVQFRQPGAVPGTAGTEVTFAAEAIDGLWIERRRVGAAWRIEFRVRAGRDELRLPLEHVVEEPRRTRGQTLARWSDHPVVVAFSDRAGVDVDVA